MSYDIGNENRRFGGAERLAGKAGACKARQEMADTSVRKLSATCATSRRGVAYSP